LLECDDVTGERTDSCEVEAALITGLEEARGCVTGDDGVENEEKRLENEDAKDEGMGDEGL
jgi:hypothetical protein